MTDVMLDDRYNNEYHAMRKNSFGVYFMKFHSNISISFPESQRRRAESGFYKILQVTLPFFWTSNYIQHAFANEIFSALRDYRVSTNVLRKLFAISQSVDIVTAHLQRYENKFALACPEKEEIIIPFSLYCMYYKLYYLFSKRYLQNIDILPNAGFTERCFAAYKSRVNELAVSDRFIRKCILSLIKLQELITG